MMMMMVFACVDQPLCAIGGVRAMSAEHRQIADVTLGVSKGASEGFYAKIVVAMCRCFLSLCMIILFLLFAS